MNEEVIELELTPVKLVSYKDNSNWGLYACDTPEFEKVEYNRYGNFSISGIMPRLTLNGNYKAKLIKTLHPTYGVGYQVKEIEQIIPTTAKEQRAYLSAILTENQVNAIYDAYPDEDVIKLFQEDRFDYQKVKGIGEITYKHIREKVLENLSVQKALAQLSRYNITYNMILKLIRHYGSAELAIQKVEENPYCLATDVSGIGFLKADTIAQNMNFDMNSPFRIRAAINYVIEQEQIQGHTYIIASKLIETTEQLLSLPREMIIEQVKKHESIVISEDRVALKSTYEAEKYIASKIHDLLKQSDRLEFNVDEFIKEQEDLLGITLTPQQIKFIENIKENRVNLLIGYAGTGKTQMQRLLINLLRELGISYRLLSPTGKAAKVLTSYVGEEATTIHRAIGFDLKGEIHEEFVIIDEASMLGVGLTSRLLRNCKHPKLKILFVGDAFQLSSVEHGNLLHDMITSGIVPMSELTQVFRQEEGGILDIATKIREGKPFIENDFVGGKSFGEDFQLYSIEQEKMIGGYKYGIGKLLEKYPIDDIMVLSSTKKGGLGTISINNTIQEIVNPLKNQVQYEYGTSVLYREGDMIINTKNLYDIDTIDGEKTTVVNGDMGRIESIDLNSKKMIIDYGFAKVPVSFSDLDTILHSYCITIHKCVTEDTWLYTSNGLMQLRELNNGSKIGEFKNIDNDITVYNGSTLEKPISFYNNGESLCKKIVTKRGYQLIATDQHGIDVLDKSGYVTRKEVGQLTKGDFLLLSKKNNVYGKQSELPQEWQDRSSLNIRAKTFNRPNQMTKEFARFLGYMVADGTVCKSGIRFSKRYLEVTKDFQDTVYKIFGYYKDNIKLRNSGDYMCEISSTDISDFCSKIDGLQPNDKYVPKCILGAPKEFQQEFLKALFEDGTVNIKKNAFEHIELSIKDFKLAQQVHLMLLNMGIVSTLAKYKNSKGYLQHRIFIYRGEAKEFAKIIGFISAIKNERLQLCFEKTEEKNNCQYVLPYVTNIVQRVIEDNKLSKGDLKYLNQSLRNKRITKYTLNKFLEQSIHLKGLDNNYDYLCSLTDDSIYLDSIKDIIDEKRHTYCLEMPVTHKFIQNGFHAYNSQGSAAKGVIAIFDKSHTYQLNANLIYTAITRAKEFVYMFCQANVINRAIKKVANKQRSTFLKELLKNEV